jgi:hypothetical protein
LRGSGERVRVRGFYFKNQIKKLTFLKFLLWLEIDYNLGFFYPSPHRQQVGSSTLPQEESDDPVSVGSIL